MEFIVKKIDFRVDDFEDSDDGMTSLLFVMDNGYFMIARTNDDDEVYFELNDPENGETFEPNIFDIDFRNGKLSLKINLKNKDIVKYLKKNNKQARMYEKMTLLFDELKENKFLKVLNIINRMFPDSNEFEYNTITGKKF